MSEETILKTLVSQAFHQEFHHEINNKRSEKKASVTLTIKKEDLKVKIEENEIKEVVNPKELTKSVAYLDDPYVLDDLNDNRYRRFTVEAVEKNHRTDLAES